jgi:hypothetical protein
MSKSKRSPSRIKYEQSHPTVSARMAVAARDRLNETLGKAGISLSDALLSLAGEIEIKLIPIEETRKAAYDEAKKMYAVPYPCQVCRNPIVITSPEAKEAAARYMTEHGWGHAACYKQVNNK